MVRRMSAPYDPMTFDELSELYRVEMKSPSLAEVRKDLYRAMATLMTSMRQEVDRQMSRDPDSVMTEGAEMRRKNADRLCKDILMLRSKKISSLAIRTAEGAHTSADGLADEEREYYDAVLDATRRQMSRIDRTRGRRSFIPTSIDGTPMPHEAVHEPEEEEPRVVEEPVRDTIVEETPAEPIPPETDPAPFEEDPFDEPFEDEQFPEEEVAEPPIRPEPVVPAEPAPVARSTSEPADVQVLIRVLEDLPPFVGAERDYSLSKEDVVTLPKALADILLDSGKAMAIKPSPRSLHAERPRIAGELEAVDHHPSDSGDIRNGLPGHVGGVVVTAQMRQEDLPPVIVRHRPADGIGRIRIAHVAVIASDEPLQLRRIGAVGEHLGVVVRLEHRDVGHLQSMFDLRGDHACIGDLGDPALIGLQEEGVGLDRVMTGRKGDYMERSDIEGRDGIERYEIHHAQIHSVERGDIAHHRHAELPRSGPCAGHVVGVLMGDEDGLDGLLVHTLLLHLMEDLLAAYTAVDHHRLAVAFDNGAIAVAPAGEDMDFQHPAQTLRL